MQDWNYLFASVTGKRHIEEQADCQDSCDVCESDKFTICVVSDGAGTCKHSDVGSKKVTESAILYFSTLVEDKKWYKNKSKITEEEWKSEAHAILTKIKEDLSKLEFDFSSLSCTIIVVIHLKNRLLITHIGDGRAGYCNSNNEWLPMMSPYKGMYNNETVFITSDIWHDEESLNKYIECLIIEGQIKAFCVMTDGCENASYDCYKIDEKSNIPIDFNIPNQDFFDANINIHIPNLIKQNKSQDELNEIWESFLEQGNTTLKNEGDDKTMILAINISMKNS